MKRHENHMFQVSLALIALGGVFIGLAVWMVR